MEVSCCSVVFATSLLTWLPDILQAAPRSWLFEIWLCHLQWVRGRLLYHVTGVLKWVQFSAVCVHDIIIGERATEMTSYPQLLLCFSFHHYYLLLNPFVTGCFDQYVWVIHWVQTIRTIRGWLENPKGARRLFLYVDSAINKHLSSRQ